MYGCSLWVFTCIEILPVLFPLLLQVIVPLFHWFGFKYKCFVKKEILTVFTSSNKVGKVWGFGVRISQIIKEKGLKVKPLAHNSDLDVKNLRKANILFIFFGFVFLPFYPNQLGFSNSLFQRY